LDLIATLAQPIQNSKKPRAPLVVKPGFRDLLSATLCYRWV
jgi:hypothetical protein